MPTANEIRQQFLDFFVKKHGHTAVPSSPVVPFDDPTLLFTNAGMNQFKDVFLGTGSRPYTRAVDSQKCIRAGGKHNDLEDVGRDTYHHTFFEMLGNWSFGDYYKREAIAWAWELLTKDWGIDKSRLHATVFGGDSEFGLEADEEAARLWTEVTDIDPSHVHRFGKKDNFWMMGETGPCGPCSEVHIDRTPDRSGGKLVNKGDASVMEIWNLVFIQYNSSIPDEGMAELSRWDRASTEERLRFGYKSRDAILAKFRKLDLLPAKHVDTGMGFERISAVLQGKDSNYDTDVFAPIMAAIGDVVKAKYSGDLTDVKDIAFRVIADHLRMATFAITDGAMPSNKDRGYVIRSVIRRAVRFGYQQFKLREPFICKLVPALVDHMGGAYPELRTNADRVASVLHGEEADFLKTIERGLKLFQAAAKEAESSGRQISGKAVFDLYTTHGFPPDLTRQMAQEQDLTINEQEYEDLWRIHTTGPGKETTGQVALNVSGALPETDDRPKWYGPQVERKILGWIADNTYHTSGTLADGSEAGLLLDKTCFYAEAGGQVGDRGTITTPTGTFQVTSTVKQGNAVVHVGKVTAGTIQAGQTAKLVVDPEREFTRKNHTATHLLHWALQTVLGEHVTQRGSKVKPDEFTFDFDHHAPLTDAEKTKVEQLVNEKIYQDLPVSWRELPVAEAKNLPGVRAFFGDKYGDVVRVVEIGDGFSREFCGGTHLDHTGQAGFFKLVGEEAVGKGVRRLIGVTGPVAVEHAQKQDAVVGALTARFRCKPEEVLSRVEALQDEIKKLQQALKKGAATDLAGAGDKLFAEAVEVNGVKVIVGELPAAPSDQIRNQVDRLRQKAGSAVVVVGWADDGKVGLLAAVTDDVVKKGVAAGTLVGEVAKVVGGKGGGKADMAQAGGKDAAKLGEAMQCARNLATQQLGG